MAQKPCTREGKCIEKKTGNSTNYRIFNCLLVGILMKKIPWAELESDYAGTLSGSDRGAPAKGLRMALGA
jgi:hypothetical protein